MSFKYYVILGGGVTERSHSITGGGTGGVKKGSRNFLMFPKWRIKISDVSIKPPTPPLPGWNPNIIDPYIFGG